MALCIENQSVGRVIYYQMFAEKRDHGISYLAGLYVIDSNLCAKLILFWGVQQNNLIAHTWHE